MAMPPFRGCAPEGTRRLIDGKSAVNRLKTHGLHEAVCVYIERNDHIFSRG